MCCLGCCTARGRVAKSVVRPLDKMPLSFSYSGYSAICPVPAHRFKHIAPNDFFFGETFANPSIRSVLLWSARFRCPFATMFAWHSKIPSVWRFSAAFSWQDHDGSCLIGRVQRLRAWWRRSCTAARSSVPVIASIVLLALIVVVIAHSCTGFAASTSCSVIKWIKWIKWY